MSKFKIMATVFWDRRGVLLVDFMPQGITINLGAYCATLRKLRRALQNKPLGMLSKGVLPFHDNARKASHFSKDSRVNRIFWLGRFVPYNIQPRPLSERFLPFPKPQTQSWQEVFQ
ncbi:uncharacterized protein TNCV_4261651 [Trichonephila clavipes]|nr:uncharacterized protein TNCV_4261651 [Trichonephila clavipes]